MKIKSNQVNNFNVKILNNVFTHAIFYRMKIKETSKRNNIIVSSLLINFISAATNQIIINYFLLVNLT
jgi:hypothetical protein